MIGVEAARLLKHEFHGPSVHRRGLTCRNMFIDGHLKLTHSVIAAGNMDPNYLLGLGSELSCVDRGVYDEFFVKCQGEVDTIKPSGRTYGSCPMLLTPTNCPGLFRQIRETNLYAILRNFMCK